MILLGQPQTVGQVAQLQLARLLVLLAVAGATKELELAQAYLVAQAVLQQHPQQLGSLLHIQAAQVGP